MLSAVMALLELATAVERATASAEERAVKLEASPALNAVMELLAEERAFLSAVLSEAVALLALLKAATVPVLCV